MDMNKSFMLRKEDRTPQWHVIDLADAVLGRECTKISDLLRGRGKPEYTPHTDNGDYVIVINCDKFKLTGNKWRDKIYKRYSGWQSGLKKETAEKVFEKDPTHIVRQAVKGMLPKNRLSRQMLRRLKMYVGSEHPHEGQVG